MIWPAEVWQQRRREHEQRVDRWVLGRQERRARGERHPVDDFLFEYYPYSVSKLRTWHPGFGITLGGDDALLNPYRSHPDYIAVDDGVTADGERFERHRARRELVLRILTNTQQRPAQTNCFGMHEWAMVYGQKQDEIRHATVPLRLSPDAIRSTVDELGLRCTHIDAYRFFTPAAAERNAITPTRETQPDLEQSGCLHANMDLYKYAMWFSPFIGSDLIADCFAFARTARSLDMQASPYDLTAFGFEPIRLETVEGRQAYVQQQTALAQAAEPIRARLIAVLIALP